MSKPTTGQHYVWRSYLAAWTKTNSPDGQIVCLRDRKPFPVSLMKVAKENSFYGVKELSHGLMFVGWTCQIIRYLGHRFK